MPKLSPTLLETIDFNTQGWTEILNDNFRKLNDNLLFIDSLLDVTLTSLTNQDMLMWDSPSQKFVNMPLAGMPTNTSTSTSTTSTTTTTTTTTTTS